jgi:hypothetical protein
MGKAGEDVGFAERAASGAYLKEIVGQQSIKAMAVRAGSWIQQFPLKFHNGRLDTFHCRLTPELSRAAKRLRLE